MSNNSNNNMPVVDFNYVAGQPFHMVQQSPVSTLGWVGLIPFLLFRVAIMFLQFLYLRSGALEQVYVVRE